MIVGTGALLEESVGNLLTQDPGVEVWAVHHQDEAALVRSSAHVQPDVIVFHESDALDSDRIFDLVRAIPVETLRVLIMRSSGPAIDLYEKRRINAADGGDFRALVLGEHGTPNRFPVIPEPAAPGRGIWDAPGQAEAR